MSSLRRRFFNHLRAFGPCHTALYDAYCLEDAYLFRLLDITAAVRATRHYVPHEESGLPNGDYVAQQPTVSFHAFRNVMDRHVAPTADGVFLDYGSGTGRTESLLLVLLEFLLSLRSLFDYAR